MPCYAPLQGYKTSRKTENGKAVIVFKLAEAGGDYTHIDLPCGRCIGCRLKKSKEWSLRCVNEASLYSANCFITLTFNPENINKLGTLVKSDFQRFMKRLRKKYNGIDAVSDKNGNITFPIRYFHCGEYGENNTRPHHHACLFNFDFDDKEPWSVRDGVPLYRSESLERLWSKEIQPYESWKYRKEDIWESNGKYYVKLGFCTVGEVTFESAAYVARYVTKKIGGDKAKAHYAKVDEDTGEVLGQLQPEYCTQSRRPGIGKGWFDKYFQDIYEKDYYAYQGKIFSAPRYYDKIYDALDNKAMEILKRQRVKKVMEKPEEVTPRRLYDKGQVKLKQFKQLKRGLENER